MIFKYNSVLDIKQIQNLIRIKKLKILDFGCGIGVWSQKNLKNENIKKITLYDKNKGLIKYFRKVIFNKNLNPNSPFSFKRSHNSHLMAQL